jgi:hypothetical protein
MALYVTVFAGSGPLGGLFAGGVAQLAGPPAGLILGGAFASIFLILAAWGLGVLRSPDAPPGPELMPRP